MLRAGLVVFMNEIVKLESRKSSLKAEARAIMMFCLVLEGRHDESLLLEELKWIFDENLFVSVPRAAGNLILKIIDKLVTPATQLTRSDDNEEKVLIKFRPTLPSALHPPQRVSHMPHVTSIRKAHT
jgi:hypothetical protein